MPSPFETSFNTDLSEASNTLLDISRTESPFVNRLAQFLASANVLPLRALNVQDSDEREKPEEHLNFQQIDELAGRHIRGQSGPDGRAKAAECCR